MVIVKYDYLVVGAGLFGSVFAYEAKKAKKRVLVIDKRSTVGGNVYTEMIENIHTHVYGVSVKQETYRQKSRDKPKADPVIFEL